MDAGVTQNALPELVVESLPLPQASRVTGYQYTSGAVWLLAPKRWAWTPTFSGASGRRAQSLRPAEGWLLGEVKIW